MEITLKDILQNFKRQLATHYPAGEIDGMVLIMLDHELGYSRIDAILHSESKMPAFVAEKFNAVARRLLNDEPLQYILGDAYFYGRHYRVTPATLIPRPETEGLIDMIADENPEPDLRVLDIGTGSGCIAISIALTLRFADVTAIDISHEALAVAQENAHKLKARIKFCEADILAMPLPQMPLYDIIVSNPPYITNGERASMERNVLDFEPHNALFVPDEQPLLFYDAIARYASAALQPGGKLYLEINSRFPAETCHLLTSHELNDAQAFNDYRGLPRFVKATK